MTTYDSVWDTPEQAENMKLRSALMIEIKARVNELDGTQAQKAARLGMTQPRLNDLLKGRIQKFSLDALVNIAVKAGLAVELRPRAA